MLLENQRKDETGRILAASGFQARSTSSLRGERAVKTKPPGPSRDDGPGGVSFDGSADLAINQGDQAMTFLPESKPTASEVITSALPFWVEPLPSAVLAQRQVDHARRRRWVALRRRLAVNHGHRAGLGHAADRNRRSGGGAIARALLGARAGHRLRHVQRADGSAPAPSVEAWVAMPRTTGAWATISTPSASTELPLALLPRTTFERAAGNR